MRNRVLHSPCRRPAPEEPNPGRGGMAAARMPRRSGEGGGRAGMEDARLAARRGQSEKLGGRMKVAGPPRGRLEWRREAGSGREGPVTAIGREISKPSFRTASRQYFRFNQPWRLQ
ncbi:hypothetical protein K32_46920 [Kaistia sp. 32K]|nr:hypothetical protein K32_46920 [Kaistia sp. 32K]